MGGNCCKCDSAKKRAAAASSTCTDRSRADGALDPRWTSTSEGARATLRAESATLADAGEYVLSAGTAPRRRVRLEVRARGVDAATGAGTPGGEPLFLRRLTDLAVKVGARTRLIVEIQSDTELQVTWYRNARRLQASAAVVVSDEGRFHWLELAAASPEDSGRWTCAAHNHTGRAECSAHLNVIVPKAYKRPEFLEELRAILTDQGTVSLECKVVGVPTPALRWFKDSEEIRAGDVFALTANPEDATSLGTYTCEASNCMGKAYSSSKVHVVGRGSREGSFKPADSAISSEPPPVFIVELQDRHIKIGEPLDLSCRVGVPPWPRSVAWYGKAGRADPARTTTLEDGAGGLKLHVPSTAWDDEGEWKCVATGAGGRLAVSACRVTIDVPKNYRKPRFMEELKAVLTEEGLVSFECKVVGFPTPQLSWFKDGLELRPGDVYQLTGSNSLGSYCCIASNCMGQASSKAELTVEDIQNQLDDEERMQLFSDNKAPKFVQPLKSQEAKINEDFKFTVKVSISPEPTLAWYRDDQPVDESPRYRTTKESKGICHLDIHQLEITDQAEWKCIATNEFGHSVTSCFLKLVIPRHFKKPRFLESLRAILSEEGAVNLECKVIGVPQPVLKWYKDGEELKPGDIHRIISGQDGTCCLGTYTCEAQNCMGIAASSASLLGFEDTVKVSKPEPELHRNISLSTIHEERTSQLYDTPAGDITLDEKGEISFSFDGKEVSVSLYETPDLTEEEALQIVEMYADQLSENITEQNVVELPPLRFVKETSTSGNLLMEAIVIDVSPDYFASAEDDLRTEADLDEMSIIEDMGGSTFPVEVTEPLILQCHEAKNDIPARPPRKKSESIKSGEDYFSLSKERSVSEKSKDQEQQPTSDSPQTFATAKSSELQKLTPQKATEDENVSASSLPPIDKETIEKVDKPRRTKKVRKDRGGSQGSRKSSTGSEKSLEADIKTVPSKKDTEEIAQKISTLIKISKVVQSHLQAVEEEVVMQSALMSSAATAKKSLEVISSVTTPIEAIQNICELLKYESLDNESIPNTFQKFVPALKSLQQNLAIIEKCVEIEGGGHTLVQRTSVCLIETLAKPMQSILSLIKNVTGTLENAWPSKNTQEINILLADITTALSVSEDSIKSVNLLKQAAEMTESTARISNLASSEPKDKLAIMQNIWKPVLKLQKSLEAIKENACSDKEIQIQDYVMDLISKPIQELQFALESIEEAAVRESNENLFDINSAILQSIVQPMMGLRNDLNSLNTQERPAITDEVIENLISSINYIKNNLIDIGEQFDIKDLEPFEENQKTIRHIARNLLTLQSNIELFVDGNNDFSFTKDFDGLQTQLAKILEHAVQLSTLKSLEVLRNLVSPTDMMNESFNYIKQNDTENFIKCLVKSVDLLQQKVEYVQLQDLDDLRECITTSLTSTEKFKLKLNESILTKHTSELEQQQTVLKDSSENLSNIVNNIKKTIHYATEESEHLDSLKELSHKEKIISLQRLANILIELRDTIAAAEVKSLESPEQITSLTEFFVAHELAMPLNELNRSLNILAQQTYEEYDTLHDSKEFSGLNTLANPFYEFHNNLTVIQHHVQSQISDRLDSFVPDAAMAKTLRDLNTCLIEVQQQFALEAGDDMSTMQDISGMKSTAETKHIIVESIPTTKIDVALETAPDIMEYDPNIGSTITLDTLQQSLKNMQECLDINSFEELKEYSFSPLRILAECVLNLKECIESSHPEQPQMLSDKNIPCIASATDIKEHLDTLENCLDTIRNQKYEQCTEANLDDETFRKLNLITESVFQLEKNVKLVKEELLKDDVNVIKPSLGEHVDDVFMSSKRDNLAINEEPLFYDNVDDMTTATDISLLKTLADPLEDLRLAVGAVRQQRIWEACDVMEKDNERTPANLAVSLQELLNGIAIVQKEIIIESAESLKYQEKSDYLQAIAKPMQELSKCIIAVQENLVNEPHDDESSLGDFTYTTTLAECLETVQRCFAVLEQHEMVDTTQASDLLIPSELGLEQYAEEFIEKEIDLQRNVMDNTMAIFVDIEKTSEMLKEQNEISVEKIEIIKNLMKNLQKIFSEPLNQVLDQKKELARILTMTENSIDDFELQELTKTVKNESLKISLKSSMAAIKNNLVRVKEMVVKINNYSKNVDFVRPIKDIQYFTKQIETLPESISHNFSFLETIIVPLREICHKFELADLTSDTAQGSDILVNSTEIVEPLKAVFNSISACKDIMLDLSSEELNEATDNLSNALEIIINDVAVTNKQVLSCNILKSISNPLRKINCIVSGRLKDFETSELSTLEISNLAEPIKHLQECLSSVQKQLMQPSDEDTLTADISLVESYAEPIMELQKDLCKIEEQILLDNKDATFEQKMSVINSVETSIHNLQDSLSEIEEKGLTKNVSCLKELQDSLGVMEQKITHLDDKDMLVQQDKAFIKSDKDVANKLNETESKRESGQEIQSIVPVLPEKLQPLLEPLTELQSSINVIQQQTKWEPCESNEVGVNVQSELSSLATKVTAFMEAVQKQQILSFEKLDELTETVQDLKVFAAHTKDLSQSSGVDTLFNSVTQSINAVQHQLAALKLESQIEVFGKVTELSPPTEFITAIPEDFNKNNLKILLEPLEMLKIALCDVQKQRVQEACDLIEDKNISAVANDNYAICIQNLEKRIATVQEELLSECVERIDHKDQVFDTLKNTLHELCECIVTVQENVNYDLCSSKQPVHNVMKVLENVKDCYNKLDEQTADKTSAIELLAKDGKEQTKEAIHDDSLKDIQKTLKEKMNLINVESFTVPLESLQVAVDAMQQELGLAEIIDDKSKVALKISSQILLDSITIFQKDDLPKLEQIENMETLYQSLTSVEENVAQISNIEKCPLQIQNTLQQALTDVKTLFKSQESILNLDKEKVDRTDALLISALDQEESFLTNTISKPLENIKKAMSSVQFDIENKHAKDMSDSLQETLSSIQNKLLCDTTHLQDIEKPLQEMCSLVNDLKANISFESQNKLESTQTLKYIVTIENCIDEAQNVMLFLKKNIPDTDIQTLELKQVVKLCNRNITEHTAIVSEEKYKIESASIISDVTDISLLKTLSEPLDDLKASIGAIQQEKSWDTCESIEEYLTPTKLNVKLTQSLQNVLEEIATVQKELPTDSTNVLTEVQKENCLQAVAKPLQELYKCIAVAQENLVNEPFDEQTSLKDFTYTTTLAESLNTVQEYFATLEQHELINLPQVLEFQTPEMSLETKDDIATVLMDKEIESQRKLLINTVDIFENIQKATGKISGNKLSIKKLEKIKLYVLKAQEIFKEPLAYVFSHKTDLANLLEKTQNSITDFEINELAKEINNKPIYDSLKQSLTLINASSLRMKETLKKINYYCRQKNIVKPLHDIKQFVKYVEATPLPEDFTEMELMKKPLREICEKFERVDLLSDLPQDNDELTLQSSDVCENFMAIQKALSIFNKKYLNNAEMQTILKHSNNLKHNIENVLKETNVVTNTSITSNILRSISTPINEINKFMINKLQKEKTILQKAEKEMRVASTAQLNDPVKKLKECLAIVQTQLFEPADENTVLLDASLVESFAKPILQLQKELLTIEENDLSNIKCVENSIHKLKESIDAIDSNRADKVSCLLILKNPLTAVEETITAVIQTAEVEENLNVRLANEAKPVVDHLNQINEAELLKINIGLIQQTQSDIETEIICDENLKVKDIASAKITENIGKVSDLKYSVSLEKGLEDQGSLALQTEDKQKKTDEEENKIIKLQMLDKKERVDELKVLNNEKEVLVLKVSDELLQEDEKPKQKGRDEKETFEQDNNKEDRHEIEKQKIGVLKQKEIVEEEYSEKETDKPKKELQLADLEKEKLDKELPQEDIEKLECLKLEKQISNNLGSKKQEAAKDEGQIEIDQEKDETAEIKTQKIQKKTKQDKQKEKESMEKEKEDSDRLEKQKQMADEVQKQKEDELNQKDKVVDRLEKQKVENEQNQKEKLEEAEKQDKLKEKLRLEKEKEESDKLEKQEAAKLEKQKQEIDRLEKEKVEKEGLEKDKQEATEIENQKQDELEQMEEVRLGKEKEESARLKKETQVAAKEEQQKADNEQKENNEKECLEKDKQEAIDIDKRKQDELKQMEKVRLENSDMLEKQKQDAAKTEKQRADDELKQKENDRLEKDKHEKNKLKAADVEKQKQEELKQQDQIRLDKEKEESDRVEKQKQETAKIEKQKVEQKEKDEKELLEKEKIEAAELEKLKLLERLEKEKQEAAEIEKQRVEDELIQKEKEEKEHLEKEASDKIKETKKLKEEKKAAKLKAAETKKQKEEEELKQKEKINLEKENEEAAKIDKQRAEDEVIQKEKDEKDRLEKDNLEHTKNDKQRVEDELKQKEKQEKEGLENDKLEKEKLEAAELKHKEKIRLEKENEDSDTLEKEKQKAAKIEKQKVEAEIKQKEMDEKERLDELKIEKEKLEAVELEKETQEALKQKDNVRLGKEKEESDRLEKEIQEAAKEKQQKEDSKQKEKNERERLEKDKHEATEIDKQKQDELEKIRLENSDRLEKEKVADEIDKQRADDELIQREKDEKVRIEKDKLEEKKKLETTELEKNKQEELKQKEIVRLEKEKSDRVEKEKQETAKIEKQKVEDEIKQKEKDEKELLEKKKLEKEKLEAAELETNKQEEIKLLEKEKLDSLEKEKQEAAKIEKQGAEDELKQKEKEEKERLEKEASDKIKETKKLKEEKKAAKLKAAETKKQKEEEELKQKEKISLEKEKEESDRLEKEKEATKLKQKAEEKDEKERLEKDNLELAKKEKVEEEQKEKERLENDKLEKEKLEAAELEKQKQEELKQKEKIRLEKEKEENDKLEKEKQEAAELEKYKQEELKLLEKAKEESDRLEKNKQEAAKIEKLKEKIRLEKEKEASDKLEEETKEAAKIEKQRVEDELKKKEKIRLEREKEESDKIEKEKQEAAKMEKQRVEDELKQKERIRLEREKEESDKLEKETQEAAKIEKQRVEDELKQKENIRLEREKEESDKLEKETQEAAKMEKQRVEDELKQKENIRLEREKEESDKLEKEKQEAAKIEKQRVEDELKQKENIRLEREKEESDKLEKETQEAAKIEKQRVEDELKQKENIRLEKEKEKSDKLEKENQEAAKIEKQRVEDELKQKENIRLEKEKEKSDKLEKENQEAAKIEKQRVEDELKQKENIRLEREKEENDKLEKEKQEAAKIEKQRVEDEKKKKEKEEKDRLEKEESDKIKEAKKLKEEKKAAKLKAAEIKKQQEEQQDKIRLEKEKEENDRLEKEKEDAIKIEKQRAEDERLKVDKLEKEKLAAADLEKQKQEELKAKKEKDESDRLEKEKQEAAKIEKQKVEAENDEKERLEKEKLEKQKEMIRLEKEKEENDRLEKEKQEAAKIEKQRVEQREKEEKERLEKEASDKETKKLKEEKKAAKLKAAETKKQQEESDRLLQLEKEKEESDKLEKEKENVAKIEKQRAEDELKQKEEKERLEKDKLLENEKLKAVELEKQKQEELKQKETVRLEKEKEENDRLEKNKQEAAKIEKQKVEAEIKQKEDDEKERLEKEKLEKEKLESDRLEKVKQEAAKIEKQRIEDELKQKEKEEKERLEKEAGNKIKETKKLKEEKKAAKLKAAETKKQQEEEELKQKEKIRLENEIEKQKSEEVKQKENDDKERLQKELLEKEKLEAVEIERKKVEEHEQEREIEKLKNTDIAKQKLVDVSKKKEQDEKERMAQEESDKIKEIKRLKEEKKSAKLKASDDKKNKQEEDLKKHENDERGLTKVDKEVEKLKTVDFEEILEAEKDERKQKERNEKDQIEERDKKDSSQKKKTHKLEERQLKKHYVTEEQSQKQEDKIRFPEDTDMTNDVCLKSVSKKSEADTKISFLESSIITDDETDKTDSSVRDKHRTDKSFSESSRTMKSTSILSNSSTNYYTSSSRQKSTPGPRDAKKKPIFSTHLTDRTAVEGSRVKLTCSVLGSPEPKVEWFRNGILLNDQNKYKTKCTDGLTTLEVLNAAPSDSADYTCTATNENGTISCSATLKVYAGFETSPIPPTFTRSIKDTYHIAEDELVLECRIRGQPVPTISWVKDGKALTSNGRYHMHYLADGLCRLVINRPDPGDTGRYTCKAENPLWSDEISHQVQFSGRDMHLASSPLRFESVRSARSAHEARRPYFSRVLADHSVPVGGTIALQVEVGGGAAEVEWRRGGVPLPPGRARAFADRNVHTLAVENASAEESGIYSCTVRNAHGTVATVATVSVLSPGALRSGKPATILARPEQDLSVCEGEDFTVSLRAQGEPKPKVIWMKGVRELTGSWRSLKEISDDYYRFTLKRAQMSDAGTYCVLAKNCYGCDRAFVTVFVRQRLDSESSTSSSSQLLDSYSDVSYMRDVPQAIVGEPEVSEVGADWVSLRWVRPPRGSAAPVLAYRVESWLQGASGGARWAPLGLSPVNGFDAFRLAPGSYLFRVTPRNRYGWGPSAQTSAAVQIGGKPALPEFTTPLPGQVKALVGEALTLVCVVSGCPAVCWLKDGEELDGDGPSAGGRCTLTVRRVGAHHQGRYCCRATTAAGSATTFARVAVVTDRKIWEADDNFKKYLESDTDDRAPVFSMRLRDRRVQVTYPVRLTCRVEGRPTPVLQWTKDGELLEQDDLHTFSSSDRFHTLEISCAQLEDGGHYAAHASNPLGAVRCAAALTVDKGLRAYLAPEFALAPDTLYRVPEGAELRVRACIEAYPSVGVAWHRDGVRLRPSRRAVFTLDREGEIEMTLAGVTRRDAGVYTVTASNMVGRATCSTRVEILPPRWDSTEALDQPPIFITASLPYSKEPMFTKKPRSSEAKEGDTVVILCEVIGDPKPEVLWLRDWLKPEYYRDATQFRRIGAGPEYRLEIPHAKLDHTGAYSVIATNCHGQAKAVISLQITAKGPDEMDQRTVKTGRVFVLPRICRELRDLRCCDGDAVTFECLVEGTPAPTLQWEKDGLPVPDSGDFKMETDGETARLMISCVYPEDEGVYTCIAFNELGKAYTSSCLIVDVPEEKENLVSQQLARPAMLLSAGSTPRSTPRSSPRNTPARSVSPHRPSRQRESVSRSPSRGSRWKLCPPKFYAVPFNRVAEEGETVSFRCSIAGHPTPTVTWDKDGSDLPGTSRITIRENEDDRILQISDVKYEDSGMYRVTLDNEVGRVEATACLDVINLRSGGSHSLRSSEGSRTSPSVRRHLNGPQSRVGDRLRLSSEIRGSPAPRSKWYRNGQQLAFSERIFEIKEGDTFNLIINSARASDSGDYTLVASNEYGDVSSWAKVNVVNTILHDNIDCIGVHQPHIIKELKDIEVTDGKAVEIQLQVENCCIFTFSWMKDNKVLPDSDIFKYIDYGNGVIGLRFEDIYIQDSGVYTCVIKNTFGLCKSSCRICVTDSTVGIALNGFSVYPESVVIQEGEDVCFSATVDTNPVLLNANVVWQIGGREVDKDSSKYKLTSQDLNHSIRLLNVQGNDSGAVRCAVRVNNPQGEPYESLWYTTQLTVVPEAFLEPGLEDATTNRREQPKKMCAKFVNKLDSITVPKRGKVSLQASFQGYPEPAVRWFKSDREIELSERVKTIQLPGESSLVIREADLSDAAIYKISIENSHGKDTLTAKVTVEDTDINKEPPPLYKIDNGNLFDSKYKIHNVIGRGHFGSVKLVVDKSTGEKLAAKFVKIMKPKDKEVTISELEIMHCLKHPKLIQLIDAFIKMNQMIIITEYVSGGQLFERVSEEDFTLTERDCILFMTQILEGVGFMHSENIVHLDLKPENIMCQTRPSHEIKIIDFGLARRLNPNEEIRTLCGTAEFIAPEVVNFDPISTASDMWSVGVICYILLSGLSPFAGDTVQDTYSNILRVKYDFEDEAFDNISEDAKEFIQDLLVKPMDKRPSAVQCLQTKWMKQHKEKRSSTALSTEKLRKFVIQSKWQMTGNAIRAVGRMASLCAISRMNTSRLPGKSAATPGPINTSSILEETSYQNAETDRDQHSKQK